MAINSCGMLAEKPHARGHKGSSQRAYQRQIDALNQSVAPRTLGSRCFISAFDEPPSIWSKSNKGTDGNLEMMSRESV
jgi:hypothetical protein